MAEVEVIEADAREEVKLEAPVADKIKLPTAVTVVSLLRTGLATLRKVGEKAHNVQRSRKQLRTLQLPRVTVRMKSEK